MWMHQPYIYLKRIDAIVPASSNMSGTTSHVVTDKSGAVRTVRFKDSLVDAVYSDDNNDDNIRNVVHSGDQALDVESAVAATDDGDRTVATGYGDLTVATGSGDLNVATGSGDLHVATGSGSLTAGTGDGGRPVTEPGISEESIKMTYKKDLELIKKMVLHLSSKQVLAKNKLDETYQLLVAKEKSLNFKPKNHLQGTFELKNLDNNLASLIDQVNYLEGENLILTQKIHLSQKDMAREVSNDKLLFQSQLNDLRSAMNLKVLEVEELKTQLDKATNDVKAAKPFKAKFDELNKKYDKIVMHDKKLKDRIKKLTKEINIEKKNVKDAQKTVEKVILEKVSAENKLLSVRQHLKHKEEEVYKVQLNELNSNYDQILMYNRNLKECVEKLTKEADTEKKNVKDAQKKLEEVILQKDTAENELVLQEVFKVQLNELKSKYDTILVDNRNLKECVEKLTKEADTEKTNVKSAQKTLEEVILQKVVAEKELRSVKKHFKLKEEVLQEVYEVQLNELKSKYDTILMDNRNLKECVEKLTKDADIEKKNVKDAQKTLEEVILQKVTTENELRSLKQHFKIKDGVKDDKSQDVLEHQDIMDTEIELDVELNNYRNLLENGEKRLSITSTTSEVGSPRSKKRKLLQGDETEYEFGSVITASSAGDIEISEVCSDGQFVKLNNKGSKEIALSGYEIVRSIVGENSSTVFKFHHSDKLEAGDSLTVWSSASNQIHDDSGSIVMNTQAWMVGDMMTTIVLNTEGQEIATHELKKKLVSHSPSHEAESIYKPGDLETGKNCVIM